MTATADEPLSPPPSPRRRIGRWLIGFGLSLSLLLGISYSQRDRIAYWLGHHEIFLSNAGLERTDTIVVRHTGLRKDGPPDTVYQFVILGPKGIGLWSANEAPSSQAIRAAPRERWMIKVIKAEEIRHAGELRVKFPMEFKTIVAGMLDCHLEKRPRTAEDDKPFQPSFEIRVGIAVEEPPEMRISNTVSLP